MQLPEAAGLLVVSHPHRQDQEGKLDIVQDRAGNGSQHAFPPPGFAVGADDDQGGPVSLSHSIQGAPRQTDGGLDDHLEALVFQSPPLGRQAGGSRSRRTLAGAAKEIRGDHSQSRLRRNTPTSQFAPQATIWSQVGQQVGGHDHPVKDGPHHASILPPSVLGHPVYRQLCGCLNHEYNRERKKSMAGRGAAQRTPADRDQRVSRQEGSGSAPTARNLALPCTQ